MVMNLVHFIGFQACWFAAVLGAADGDYWRGPICIGIFTCLHVLILARRLPEVFRLAAAALFGLFADSILIFAGVLSFGLGRETLPPAWMISLWVLFMTTLSVTMPWLRRRYILGALVGAVAGPASYFAGAKLGALDIDSATFRSIILIALEWTLALPLLIYLTELTGSWHKTEASSNRTLVTKEATR